MSSFIKLKGKFKFIFLCSQFLGYFYDESHIYNPHDIQTTPKKMNEGLIWGKQPVLFNNHLNLISYLLETKNIKVLVIFLRIRLRNILMISPFILTFNYAWYIVTFNTPSSRFCIFFVSFWEIIKSHFWSIYLFWK